MVLKSKCYLVRTRKYSRPDQLLQQYRQRYGSYRLGSPGAVTRGLLSVYMNDDPLFFSHNILDVLDGYNGTVFAYGQTGSGKTFTMMVRSAPICLNAF